MMPRPGRVVARAFSVLLLAAVSALVSCRDVGKDSPHLWPEGNADDIEALSTRDDVNVLLILVDTLRADRLSAYGYERATSPVLANLSRMGVRFDRHLSQSSWTKASMASMWTSYIPPRTGVVEYDDVVPDAAPMPAEILSEHGFRTIGLYRNGWVEPKFGFGQGFEVYTKPAGTSVDPAAFRENPTLLHTGTDEDLVESALAFLRADGANRWFLYLHFMDVHEYTYDEQSAVFGGSYSDMYDNSVLRTDTTIDQLLGGMMDMGLFKNTLIVIASDHGEAFRERGIEGHARFVFKETTEVPLIVLFPFRLLEREAVVRARTRNVDIWPTIYELLGIDPPADLDAADGVSLVPEILAAARGGSSPPEVLERQGFAHLMHGWGRPDATDSTYALASRDHRFVSYLGEGGARIERLFDTGADPAELRSVVAERPELAAEMRERADAMAKIDPVWGQPEEVLLKELELRQLRALGYVLPGDDGR